MKSENLKASVSDRYQILVSLRNVTYFRLFVHFVIRSFPGF